MERVFKFELGDVVRMKESDERLTALIEGGVKEYREHLTVVFMYWDGAFCNYVLNTGDGGICLICDEEHLELEERPPMPAEVHPECAKESYFLGYVYRMNNRLVAAESIEQAIRLFHDNPCHRSETIGKIIQQDTDFALIQNGKEE